MFEFASAIIGCYTGKECSQGSGNCALYKCGIEMYPMTGVIIRCSALGLMGKAHIKISYYLLLLLM